MDMSRVTLDSAAPTWAANRLSGPAPESIRTHETLKKPGPTSFVSVTEGPDSVPAQAGAAAGDGNLKLWGAEQPLFAHFGGLVTLERLQAIPTPAAIHLRYRMVKENYV